MTRVPENRGEHRPLVWGREAPDGPPRERLTHDVHVLAGSVDLSPPCHLRWAHRVAARDIECEPTEVLWRRWKMSQLLAIVSLVLLLAVRGSVAQVGSAPVNWGN